MKAMILAAGLGTRLRPLTEKLPKALMPVVNTPALARNIDYLHGYGIKEIIVNCHYLGQKIIDYAKTMTSHDLKLEVKEEPEILGTGGGIANCRDFLEGETFVVINSDIITNIDLNSVLENHKISKKKITMTLHDMKPFNQIRLDSDGDVAEIRDREGENLFAFTGIHVMEPEIFSYISNSEYSNIIDEYRSLIASGKSINAYIAEGHFWHDIGTIEKYMNANRDLLKMSGKKFTVGTDTFMDTSLKIKNWAVIGSKNIIKKNTVVESSIIWDNVILEKGVIIKNSIVTSGNRVKADLYNKVL